MLKKFLIGTIAVLAVGFVLNAASASADCSITTTLKVGSKGAEVSCLQTKVGATSDGSFGPMTKASVMAYQSNHGLSADGVVGPMSRAVLNGAVSGNFPAGCLSASGFSSTTGLACVALPSSGPCSAGALFNSATGASCSGAAAVSSTGEGSLTVTYDAVPASNLAVLKGENKSVMAIKLKATGSDMKVSRLWLDIDKRIWLSADTATLLDGSTVISTLPLSASTVTETTIGSAWQMQFNGLNVVVPNGATKILTLTINRPTLTQNSDSVAVAATSTIRATDGAGISNTYTLTGRTINLSSSTAATTGTLTTNLSSTSPLAQSVTGISATAGVLTPVKLMDFDLKSQDSAINVTALTAGLTTTTATLVNQVASVELRDGTSVLASMAPVASNTTTAAAAFTALNINVAKNTTKVLSIWVQMNPIGAADAAVTTLKGVGITASITASTIVSTDASYATVATPTNTVTGNAQYMFQYAPTFTLGTVSAVNSGVDNKAGTFSLSYNVTAPTGSDIYLNAVGSLCGGTYPATKIAAVCTDSAIGGTMITSVSVSGASSKGTNTLATWDKIAAGTTKTVTLTGMIPSGTAGFTYMSLITNGIQWTDTDNITINGVASTEQTWGISDFRTPSVAVAA